MNFRARRVMATKRAVMNDLHVKLLKIQKTLQP